jgi:Ran GTPase-activating protein (RanGAP) involved in mRNA processing and transport
MTHALESTTKGADDKITSMDMSKNQSGLDMDVLKKLIHKKDALKMIDLSDNELRNGGMQAVADILKENTSIEKILLQRNSITFEGLQLLCGCLIDTADNTVTVREIDIRDNLIEDS